MRYILRILNVAFQLFSLGAPDTSNADSTGSKDEAGKEEAGGTE